MIPAGRPRTTLVALSLLAALAIGGCGSEPEPPAEITIAQGAPPDSLDPALAFRRSSLESLWLVHTPLLTYRRAEGEEGAELIGGLASDLPEVSEDGRTYRLHLREALAYSDGREVRASDFERAIERARALESPAAPSFSGVRAIDADDDSGEIVIRLDAPDPAFAETLALVAAAPVPPGTPARDQSADPPPGVGPYAITSADPETGFTLERSPNFADLDVPDIPTGNLERITTRIGGGPREQAEGVLDGEFDYTASQPPPEMRAEIATRAGERFAEHLTPPTYYAFLGRPQPDRVASLHSERMDPSASIFHPVFGDDYSSWRLEPRD